MSNNGQAVVPRGWAKTTLGEITTLNPRFLEDPPADNELVSFVPMAAVEAGTGGINTSQQRPWKEVRKGYTPFQDGDVLFAKITPCMENGKCAVAQRLSGGRGAGSTEFHVLRPMAVVDPKLILYFLLQESYRREARTRMQGAAGQLRVPSSFIEETPFNLPPRPEQHRIIAEIEKQFTRLDAGVAALTRAQANLKRYRAAVLKTACEGRLVPTEAELACTEGRAYEPADQLLTRILKERRAKWEADQIEKMRAAGKMAKDDEWKTKYREPVAPDTINLPELPEGWVWTSIDAMLVEPLCNGISIKGRDAPPGVAALKLNAMSERGFKYHLVRYIPIDEAVAEDLEVVAGDFFVSRGNGSLDLVGRGTLAQAPPFQVVFPDTMIRLRFSKIIGWTAWVPTIWPAQFVRHQIQQKVKTTAGIWKIAQPEVASIVVPFPPLAEQRRIIAEVERRLSVIDELEAVVAANFKRAERLRQSILKRAFEGKLVPQDPTDEPASVLLERIRDVRAQYEDPRKPMGKATAKGADKRQKPLTLEAQTELFC